MLRGLRVLQEGPGKYNDNVWEAMDRVLDEARRAGLKVMLSFLDNWKYNGAPTIWDEQQHRTLLPARLTSDPCWAWHTAVLACCLIQILRVVLMHADPLSPALRMS